MANEYSIVDCSEEKTPPFTISDVGGVRTAQVTLRCAMSEWEDLVKDVVGRSRLFPKCSGNVRAVGANITGQGIVKGASVQEIDYEYALVKVDYETRQFNIGIPDPQPPAPEDPPIPPNVYDAVSEVIVPRIEFRNLDHKKFKWETSSRALQRDESPGLQLPRMDITRTYTGVSSAQFGTISDFVGDCNNAAITSLLNGITFQPETLMLAGFTPSTAFRSDGTLGINVVFNYTWKKEGWNTWYVADQGAYDRIVGPTGPHFNHIPKDFSGFFI